MDKEEIEEIGSIVDSDVESNDSDVESVTLKDEFDIEDLDDEKIGDDEMDEDDEKKEIEDDG